MDETTDAWDTVDWLVRNVPGTNGRVGVTGVSYPGWTGEVVLLDPHPAVRAVSPQAPMTDTWMGDDFFHQGAFRLLFGFGYSWDMEGQAAGMGPWPQMGDDQFDWFLSFPSLQAMTDSLGLLRIPTWRRFVEHPVYDAEWQGRAFRRAGGDRPESPRRRPHCPASREFSTVAASGARGARPRSPSSSDRPARH